MDFCFCDAIGEHVYAICTCCPNILAATIKLSQYSVNPTCIHYQAIHNVFYYLHNNLDNRIYYWHEHHVSTPLPNGPSSKLFANNYAFDLSHLNQDCHLHVLVDCYWTGKTTHCKSATCVAVIYAGSVIGDKMQYQDTITQSSMEAEFFAVANAS